MEEEGVLAVDLMKIFKTKNVDLVSLRSVSPLLLNEIFKTGRVLYEGMPSLFNEFGIYAFRNYLETKPLLKLRSDYLNKKAAIYKKELKYV